MMGSLKENDAGWQWSMTKKIIRYDCVTIYYINILLIAQIFYDNCFDFFFIFQA